MPTGEAMSFPMSLTQVRAVLTIAEFLVLLGLGSRKNVSRTIAGP